MFFRNGKTDIMTSAPKVLTMQHAVNLLMGSKCINDEIEFQVLNNEIRWQGPIHVNYTKAGSHFIISWYVSCEGWGS